MQIIILILIILYSFFSILYLKGRHPSPRIKKLLFLVLVLNLIAGAVYFRSNQKLYSVIYSDFCEYVLIALSVFLTYLLKTIYSIIDLGHSSPGIFQIAVSGLILLLAGGVVGFKKPKLRLVFLTLLCSLGLIFIFYFLAQLIVYFDVEQNRITWPLSFSLESIIRIGSGISSFLVKNILVARKIIPLLAIFILIVLACRKTRNSSVYFIVFSTALALIAQSFVITTNYSNAIYLYIVAGLSILMACLYQSPGSRKRRSLSPFKQIVLITLILLIAIVLGLYKLELYPVGYSCEAISGTTVMNSAMKLNNFPSSFQNCLANIKQSPASYFLWEHPNPPRNNPGHYTPLYSFSIFICLKLFPVDVVTTRISTVLTGVLCVLFLFLFVRRLFNPSVALLSAFMLAISTWQLVLIRANFTFSATHLYLTICLYLFWKALQTRKLIFYLLMGIMLSIFIPFYPSIKMIIYLITGFVLYRSLIERKFLKQQFWGLFLMVAMLLVMLHAQEINPAKDYLIYNRTVAGPIFENVEYLNFSEKIALMGKRSIIAIPNFISRIYITRLFQFILAPYIEQGIQFNFLLLPFASLGFFWSLFKARRRNYSFLLLWLLFSMMPNIVTGGGCVDRRATLIIAPLMVMAALGIYKSWHLTVKFIFKSDRWYRPITAIALIMLIFLLLSTSAANFFYTYYSNENSAGYLKECQTVKKIDWFLEELFNHDYIYLLSSQPDWNGGIFHNLWPNRYLQFRMYSKKDGQFIKHHSQRLSTISELADITLNPPENAESFAVLVNAEPDPQKMIDEMSKLYPGKVFDTFNFQIKPNVFSAIGFVVDQQDIAQLRRKSKQQRDE